VLSEQGLTQLRLAETEKYAHVTFFFSGGREAVFPGEERALIPSPEVMTYDLKPEMSAHEVTDTLVDAIASQQYDFIVVNYANGDMVGHTGNFEAAVIAVETLDTCLGRIVAALAEHGGEGLLTADHGNCEQMRDYENEQPHTQHTTERVPLIYLGRAWSGAEPGRRNSGRYRTHPFGNDGHFHSKSHVRPQSIDSLNSQYVSGANTVDASPHHHHKPDDTSDKRTSHRATVKGHQRDRIPTFGAQRGHCCY
jgi:hypothetical protein